MPVMYHGSPHKLTHLRAGSWVTPHRADAAVFGVPWGSDELVGGGGKDGRPPATLRFKGEPPPDHPVYVYRVDADVVPARTNTGVAYDWNHQVPGRTKVELVDTIPSWKEELMPFASKRQQRAMFGGHIPGMDKEDAHRWADETKSIKKLPDRAPAEKGKATLRSKKAGSPNDRMHDALDALLKRRAKHAADDEHKPSSGSLAAALTGAVGAAGAHATNNVHAGLGSGAIGALASGPKHNRVARMVGAGIGDAAGGLLGAYSGLLAGGLMFGKGGIDPGVRIGLAAGKALGAGLGNHLVNEATGPAYEPQARRRQKRANGDMLQYFLDHPDKAEEHFARRERKEKRASSHDAFSRSVEMLRGRMKPSGGAVAALAGKGSIAPAAGNAAKPMSVLSSGFARPKLSAALAETFKIATLGAATMKPRNVGRLKGMMTTNAMKSPGYAASTQAMNPRKNVISAMNASKPH